MINTGLPIRARCPRCGYDQRGEIAQWMTSCPLTGVCTECGLEIHWREVLNPKMSEPRWCVEFVELRDGATLAALATLGRTSFKTLRHSLWPWHFWSRVKMSHAIRGRRIAAYVVFLFLILVMMYVPWQGGLAAYHRYQIGRRMQLQQALGPAHIQSLQMIVKSMESGEAGWWDRYTDAERDRQIAAYKAQLQAMQSGAGFYGVDFSYPEAMLEAVFKPAAWTSAGTVTESMFVSAYPPPVSLYSWDWTGAGGAGGSGWNPMQDAFVWLGLAIVGTCAFPALFILLPATRKRAKVRWAHIARAWVYGFAVPLVVLPVCAILYAGSILSTSNTAYFYLCAVSILGVWLLAILWWWAVLRCYLKIPHALFTVIVLMFLLMLLSVAAAGISSRIYSILVNL